MCCVSVFDVVRLLVVCVVVVVCLCSCLCVCYLRL